MKDLLEALAMWTGILFYFLFVVASMALPGALLIAVILFIISRC